MRFLLFGLLLAANIAGADAQTRNSEQRPKALKTEVKDAPRLELTTRIFQTKSTIDEYTRFEVEKGVVRSKSHTTHLTRLHYAIELTFTNSGTQPIILFKKSNLVSDWAISRDLKATLAKKYVSEGRSHYIAVGDFLKAGWREDEPEQDQFVVLKPGESYVVERPYSLQPYDKKGRRLKPGKYYLQVWVQTWYFFKDAKTYRDKWRDKGYLWDGPVIPKPILFTIGE